MMVTLITVLHILQDKQQTVYQNIPRRKHCVSIKEKINIHILHHKLESFNALAK